MKKVILLIVLLLIIISLTHAERVASFPDVMKPQTILVDNGQLFVLEGIHLYIYSLKDFSLQKKMGKSGEGPQEFKKMPSDRFYSLFVYIKPKEIFISSLGKASYFSRAGTFKNEFKTGSPVSRFAPLGDEYAGFGFGQDNKKPYVALNTYDTEFKLKKELMRFDLPGLPGKKVNPITMALLNGAFLLRSSGDHVFVQRDNGNIHAFNAKGENDFTIDYKFPRVEITAGVKSKFDKFFSEDIRFSRFYKPDKARNNLDWSDYLPIIKEFRAADQKIYVISYEQADEKHTAFVFDNKGKLIKKVMMPLATPNVLEIHPFDISNNKLFQLVENEDEEEWELHVTEIK
jgi:hypothetical protein